MLIAADRRHSHFGELEYNSKISKEGNKSLLLSLVRLVGRHTRQNADEILTARRGRKSVAESRQLAMYLLHILVGENFSTIGQHFGRDRTTVAHACACVEDRRESISYDEMVSRMEDELKQQLKMMVRL